MDAIIDFIKQRLVGELVGLAALCTLVWYAGPMVTFGTWTPLQSEFNRLLLILVLFICWAARYLFRQARARKNSSKLMTELAGATTNPDQAAIEEAQSEEAATLGKRFDEALKLLKTTQSKGKKSNQYLYELPWYVIIGGPGAGKTTLLFNSGLQFPLSEQLGNRPVKGVGGTRDCDWFFTEEAIFLDTAGRYTTQDSFQAVDKAAWNNFLGLLKKYRPRLPINGVMLTMSMSELMSQSEEDRQKRTRELRQRIMELYEVLGNRFPIYMIFTKCDLIAGLTDFFSELGQEERSQVWGETFAHDGPKQFEKHLVQFEADFDEVLRRMNHWSLKRIQEEHDIHRRGLILSFSQQIATLKPTITGFLSEIFGSSRFAVDPLLRGVYFTSATQEGTPIDRLMGALANAYGMDRQELPVFSGRGKSFFITRLLREVMFPESELAGVDARIERRKQILRWSAYGALGMVMAVMFALWTLSYLNNKQAIAQVEEKIHQYRNISGQLAAGDEPGLRMMAARLQAMDAAYKVYAHPSWKIRLGLYQGNKIQEGIKDAYQRNLMDYLLPEIGWRLRTQINEAMQRGDAADSGFLYELLRAYLMLGLPDKMNTAIAGATIKKSWERSFPREPQLVEQLCAHSENLLKLRYQPLPPDQILVENVRRKFKAVPMGTQIYNHLKSVALNDHSKDFRIVDAVPHLLSETFTTVDGRGLESQVIPGLYTLQGYNHYLKGQGLELVKRALADNWVLNQYSDQTNNLGLLYDDLENQYFAEYEVLWRKVLTGLKLKKPQGIYETIRILDYLSGPDTPLKPLLLAIEQNTCLADAPGKDASERKSKEPEAEQRTISFMAQGRQSESASSPARKLEAAFQPLNRLVQSKGQASVPLDDVLKTLREIRDVMMQITSGASNEEQALKYAKERMTGFGAADAMKRANLEFARLPEPLQEWLKSLASSGWDLTMERAKSGLNSLWQTEVVAHYTKSLKGRYPLVRNSRMDATMSDFWRFFGPRGLVDKFFETNLKAFVNTTGPEWRQVSMDSNGMRLSPEVLTQLRYASKIRDAFVGGGADTIPNLRFQLKPLGIDSNVASFRISIDGQTAEYAANGPATSSSFQWPGPSPNLGVILTFTTADNKMVSQTEEGPWALMKTLDKAGVAHTRQPELFIVTFQAGGLKARYELRAGSVENPFNLKELQQFRCPESL